MLSQRSLGVISRRPDSFDVNSRGQLLNLVIAFETGCDIEGIWTERLLERLPCQHDLTPMCVIT